MHSLITRPSRPPHNSPYGGGRVCSLNYRPRRWFGYRLEEVLRDFLGTDEPHLGGLPLSIIDMLRGSVRSDLDERVLVSAHQSPALGRALVTVTLFFRVPSSDGEEMLEVLSKLGRGNHVTSYYRLAEGDAYPVRGRLRIRSTLMSVSSGESTIVTTMTATATSLPPKTSSPNHDASASSG